MFYNVILLLFFQRKCPGVHWKPANSSKISKIRKIKMNFVEKIDIHFPKN